MLLQSWRAAFVAFCYAQCGETAQRKRFGLKQHNVVSKGGKAVQLIAGTSFMVAIRFRGQRIALLACDVHYYANETTKTLPKHECLARGASDGLMPGGYLALTVRQTTT
jgi:hypothetical protein